MEDWNGEKEKDRSFRRSVRPPCTDFIESWIEVNRLERDDRWVWPLGVEADRQIELGSGLTSDESLRHCTSGKAGPSRAWLEAR